VGRRDGGDKEGGAGKRTSQRIANIEECRCIFKVPEGLRWFLDVDTGIYCRCLYKS
jgi:hypothetical protein